MTMAAGGAAIFLKDLQANILQPHGRRNATLLLLSFGSNGRSSLQPVFSWIGNIADEVTTAASDYAEALPRRSAFVSFLLSARGYARLRLRAPNDTAFRAGMRSRREVLQDPPVEEWEDVYQRDAIDALLILADDDSARLSMAVVRHRFDAQRAGLRVLAIEHGHQLRRDGHDVEHFGFVDGISQPEFFPIEQTTRHWNAKAELDLVLAEEPTSPGHFGSCVVFRKLEQDVALWNHAIRELAAANGIDEELAAARAMGRFKDGTSLLSSPPGTGPQNDFNYADDPSGALCPLNAHIRKTNPREAVDGTAAPDERRRRIARRGITYGLRPDLHPNGRRFFPPPHTGVGLLFICYQANIEDQFEYIQGKWANDVNPCRPGAGLDPLIGQCRDRRRENPTTSLLPQTVRLRGGEYFFAPSLTTLRRIGEGE